MAETQQGRGSWLCPQQGDRARLLDMDRRLKPVRMLSFATLGAALAASGPWVGWWTLIPLALAALGFALVERGIEHRGAPEYPIAGAWLFAQLAIAASIVLTGGPHSPAVAWLAIPAVTLSARFSGRGMAAGITISAALMIAVTLGPDAQRVLDRPQSLLFPLALLAAISILSTALMRSDMEHRSEAVIDPLTGMLNRNALLNRAAELSQQARINRNGVALIEGDLDNFKAINDEHGHATGDAVLRDVAYRIRKQLRAYDLAYRVGGEEFLVMVPGATVENAAELAEDLRRAVAAEPAAGVAVTMSFGVAASDPGAFDYPEVFAEADAALYEAKSAGRDAVRVHGARAAALTA